MLGLAVRSVQMMVDRGDLEAWKTPGGHRRIALKSVEHWCKGERKAPGIERRRPSKARPSPGLALHQQALRAQGSAAPGTKVLLIEDSVHFQNMVKLLLKQQFEDLTLEVASDGIAGLVMTGQFQPDVLLVDILLPGIDGATLVTSLRAMPQFEHLELIVITSLDADQLAPYAFALQGLPIIHKPQLVQDLPRFLKQSLERLAQPEGSKVCQ